MYVSDILMRQCRDRAPGSLGPFPVQGLPGLSMASVVSSKLPFEVSPPDPHKPYLADLQKAGKGTSSISCPRDRFPFL